MRRGGDITLIEFLRTSNGVPRYDTNDARKPVRTTTGDQSRLLTAVESRHEVWPEIVP